MSDSHFSLRRSLYSRAGVDSDRRRDSSTPEAGLLARTIVRRCEPTRDTMIRVPTHRPPTHPGEMLVEEFLTPMGINQSELAEFIHPRSTHQRNHHLPTRGHSKHR